MRTTHTVILIAIVLLELSVAGWLSYTIYSRTRNASHVLGSVTVVPMEKENYISSPSANLKYYFESLPDPHRQDSQDWLNTEVYYTINDDSLNDSKNYAIEKSSDTFRIMTLGDSYTFGHYVNTEDNWTEQLEKMLNKSLNCPNIRSIEVINLAEPGFDVEYITYKFLTRGKKYNSDLLIWFESSADFYRVNEMLSPIVRKYQKQLTKQEIDQYRAKGEYFPAYDKAYKELYNTYSQDQILQIIGKKWLEFFNVREQVPVVLALPMYIVTPDQKKWVQSLVKNLPKVDIYDGISDLDKLNGLYPDGHPSPTGHAIIAKDIHNYIIDNNVIPCKH